MNEIVFSASIPWTIQKSISVLLIILIVIWVIAYFVHKTLNRLITRKKYIRFKIYPFLYAIFFTVGVLILFYYPVIYSFDYSLDSRTSDNIYVENILSPTANFGYRILGSNEKKYIIYDEYIYDFMEYADSLEGVKCEIEYYKLSKYVTKIIIVE